MAYINKQDILHAYKVLSTMSPNPNLQGATQRVSALRYFIALDMFCYKTNNNECNSRERKDTELFEKYVGQICSIKDNLYTPNFYYPLKSHNGNYNNGSNFYSVGQVKVSLINPVDILDYPKRGNAPLFRIRNGVLIKDFALYQNINSYLETEKIKAALVVWISRNLPIIPVGSTYSRLKNTLEQIISSEMINMLMPDSESYYQEIEELLNNPLSNTPAEIFANDLAKLFPNNIKETSYNGIVPHQVIHYGAPGTGKSYKIKAFLEAHEVAKENIFRTTFHPDSDYASFVGAYKPSMTRQYRYTDAGVKTKYYEDDDLAHAKKNEPIVDKQIAYHFVPQAFLNAYVRAYEVPNEEVYLVIEEINRGNCAQIFGDLFQLLDRNEEGRSDYTIKADADLKTFLEDRLGKDHEGIQNGELALPANLYIFATMNTSDQSLFPIDSAFKRRWDWIYEPIKYAHTDWRIEVGTHAYNWVAFQKEINRRIFEATHSEDKMLGDYFVKPQNGIISQEMLLNKVLFYLWNDVCKDGEGDIFKTSDAEELTFSALYGSEGTEKLVQMLAFLGIEARSMEA